MTASSDPKRAKFSLSQQADEAHEILTQRYRSCSARVRDGHMSQADADHSIALARAMRDTLRLFTAFEDEVRAVIRMRLDRARENEELDALRQHPGVAAVLAEFPDADIGLPAAVAPDDFTPEPPPFDIAEQDAA